MYSRPFCCAFLCFYFCFVLRWRCVRAARAPVDLCTWKKNCKAHSFVYIYIGSNANEPHRADDASDCVVRSCLFHLNSPYIQQRIGDVCASGELWVCIWVLTQTIISTTWVWLTDTVCKQRALLTHICTPLNNGPDWISRSETHTFTHWMLCLPQVS